MVKSVINTLKLLPTLVLRTLIKESMKKQNSLFKNAGKLLSN